MNQHKFERGLTGNCKKCGYIENHTFHMPSNTSIPIRESIVDKDFKDSAFEKLKTYTPSSATVNNHKWHKRFLVMADHIAQWGHDPSTKCGSVLVDSKQRIVSLGYNGFSRNVVDSEERLINRELKYELTIHAEMNAILFANKTLDDCTIYVTPMGPCSRCASVIIQVGIKRVVSPKLSEELEKRWGRSIKLSKVIFKEAGVEWLEI